jgi:hypothetical protein
MTFLDITLFAAVFVIVVLLVVVLVYLLTVKVKVPTASDVVVPNSYYVNYMSWGRQAQILTKGKPLEPEKHGILKTVRFYRAAFVREHLAINASKRMTDILKLLETEGADATKVYLRKEIRYVKARSRVHRRTRQR